MLLFRRWGSRTLGAIGLSALLFAIGGTGATASGSVRHASASTPYQFVISNNFLGNDFRPEVERIARLTANLPPFKGKISLKIVNSANTNEAQIQSILDITASKPAALLIDPGSATALNPAITQACNAGIVVVDYDQPLTAPCARKVLENMGQIQQVAGRWMAQELHGKGSVFIDEGLAGAPESAVIANGFLKGLHQYGPNIKIAGTFYSQYNEAQGEQAIDGLLVAHPHVNGILNQGYCTSGFSALKSEKEASVPSVCYSYMGQLVACAAPGNQCAVADNAPDIIQVAMKLALDVLEHKPTPPKSSVVPVPLVLYVTNYQQFHPKVPGVTIEQIKLGVNAFPKLSPGLGTPWTLPQYHITAQQVAG